MQLFGTSGIRRLVDRDLVQLALQVGMATGTIYRNVIIGRDTRTSGSVLRHAVTAGILASGARCSDAGIVPTPTVAFISREFEAGIMITASHNPPQYNGLKFINPDGSAFSAAQQKKIEYLINGIDPMAIRWDRMQSGEVYSTAVDKHIARIRQDFPSDLKIKVVVDSGCGAAYFITPHLLTQLGCEVTTLNCYPDGIFPHDIEPVEANLADLMEAVKESGADLGIAHDGDADRMMAIDDKGRFISGDKLLAILAGDSGSPDIVTTIDASMGLEKMNFNVKRSRVGDPYVSEELKKWGGFGGEPSGAWVFPQISLCPDGIYAAARIVAIASREKLSYLADNIPSYPVMRGNINGQVVNMNELENKLLSKFNPQSIDTIDGLKLVFPDGWLLIRPSGTEPKIRISAEAIHQSKVHYYYKTGSEIVSSCLEGKNI